MMDTAIFFRNVGNLNNLKELTVSTKGVFGEYQILSRVVLSKAGFEDFCRDFTKGYSFLQPFAETSIVRNNIWNCIAVENEIGTSILVMTNGYQYPRFVAIPNEQSK